MKKQSIKTISKSNKNWSLHLGQTTRPYNNQQQQKKKKRTCKIVDVAGLADTRIKLKESERKDKHLDRALE